MTDAPPPDFSVLIRSVVIGATLAGLVFAGDRLVEPTVWLWVCICAAVLLCGGWGLVDGLRERSRPLFRRWARVGCWVTSAWLLVAALALDGVEDGWLIVVLGIGVLLAAGWYALVTLPALAGVAIGTVLADASARRDRERASR